MNSLDCLRILHRRVAVADRLRMRRMRSRTRRETVHQAAEKSIQKQLQSMVGPENRQLQGLQWERRHCEVGAEFEAERHSSLMA